MPHGGGQSAGGGLFLLSRFIAKRSRYSVSQKIRVVDDIEYYPKGDLMSSAYDDLIDQITANGVERSEAEHAARQCALAMAKGGLVGYTAMGAFAYFLAMNPTTAIPYLAISTAAGSSYQLLKSPACSEVRSAISFWNTAAF